MLAEKNEVFQEVERTVRRLSEDEKIKMRLEAEERYECEKASVYHFGLTKGRSEGMEIGRREGIEIGRSEGVICGAVEMLRDLGHEDAEIKSVVMKKYGLSEEEMKEYLLLQMRLEAENICR